MIDINELKKTYGNELAAIVLCCRVFFGTAWINELEVFIGDNQINWETFLCLSKRHRVRPLVYRIIYELNIPPQNKLTIQEEYATITRQNFLQALETERIIILLNLNNIDTVPYKGIAYSKQFFGDLVSRESTDIDLVIKPEDLNKAIQILKKDGYIPELDDVYQYLGKRYFSYFKDYNLNKFTDGQRDFHIELHWAIAENAIGVGSEVNSFFLQTDNYITLVNTRIKILSRLSHFSAILVHHSFKDNFGVLKNIVDLSQAIRQPDLQADRDNLNKTFNLLGLHKSLVVSNTLSKQLLGISLSKNDAFEIPYHTVAYFLDKVCSTSAASPNDDKTRMSLWIRNTALLQDSFIRKLRFYWICWAFRFIPGRLDFRLIQLPRSLFFIYYLMKPFRTITRSLNS